MIDVPGTKLYVVKLRSPEEAVSFYDDMETPGGNLYIPDRVVEASFTNHKTLYAKYRLTEAEAEQVAGDSRVEKITLDDSELPISNEPVWTQTDNFFRGTYTTGTTVFGTTGTYSGTDKNWGLVKITTGKDYYTLSPSAPDYRWGSSNGVFRRLPWTVATKFDGQNVDVVIVDGHLRQNHAEFAVNPDGTGGSRCVNYNWHQHAVNDPLNTDITKVHHPSAVGQTYNYFNNNANKNPDAGDHGTHVAGTVAGNTQGWARKANIYNISIFDDVTTYGMSSYVYDYIRAFHASKAINPQTGRKNPTIVNASIGSFWVFQRSYISGFTYRGTAVTGTLDRTGNIIVSGTGIPLTNYGMGYSVLRLGASATDDRYWFPKNFPDSLMADIEAMINDGIIFVCAAGNDNWTQEIPSDPGWTSTSLELNYNFSGTIGATPPYLHYYSRRGGCQTETTINVAAAGYDAYEYLTDFTNRGNAVTIVSPGQGIISSVANVQPTIYSGTTAVGTRQLDSRNLNSDRIEPYNGTSMASPQVAGVLALLAEVAPDMTNAMAKAYLAAHAKTNQLNDFATGTNALYFGLKNTVNRYLFLPQQTITVTQSTTSADKGTSVTYNITTTNLPPNSTLYWTIAGTALAADFQDSLTQGSVSIASTTGTITRQINTSATYGRNYTLSLRSGGYSGNVQVLTNTVTIAAPTTTTTTTTSAPSGGTSTTTTTSTSSTSSTSTSSTSTSSTSTSSTSTSSTSTSSTSTSSTSTSSTSTSSTSTSSTSTSSTSTSSTSTSSTSTSSTSTSSTSTSSTSTSTTAAPSYQTKSLNISADIDGLNLRRYALSRGWNEIDFLVIIIESGVVVSGSSPAITIVGPYPNGLHIINNGYIIGRGGNGGGGGKVGGGTVLNDTQPGRDGETALNVATSGQKIYITNNGIIAGGGGGGGGGGVSYVDLGYTSGPVNGGGGGGGQGGRVPSIGGNGSTGFGTNGTFNGPGAGETNGGNGGAWGESGKTGGNGDNTGSPNIEEGRPGGLAGYWVDGADKIILIGTEGPNERGRKLPDVPVSTLPALPSDPNQPGPLQPGISPTTLPPTTVIEKNNFTFFNRGFAFSECCGEDSGKFAFYRGAKVTIAGPTSSTTSTTSTTTAGPPPEPFYPILDLVKKDKTSRRFIARLRQNSPTGPIVANSKVITVTNMPSNALLPQVFTNPLLSDQISTRLNRAYHQKTINTLTIAGSRIDLRTVDSCYDDRVFVYVTGRITGNVWGGGDYYGTITPYSEDSDINTAAVHAGVVQVNQTALVRRYQVDYYKEETRPSFFGEFKNGIESKTRLEGCGYYFDPAYVAPIPTDGFYFFKETFTATANQKVFTVTRPADYLLQQCLIFHNGLLLDISEYIDTPGSTGTVTLVNGATAGDIVTVMSFKSSNSGTGVFPSFTRHSEIINYNNKYFTTGFTVTEGVDLLFVNGVILPKTDYTINNGVIDFPHFFGGIITVIVWSVNNKSEPTGNPLNITTNTVITQATYNTPFDPLAFNLYNNGVLMVVAVDYTVGVDSYTLTVAPTSNLNTLLQQSFTRIGS